MFRDGCVRVGGCVITDLACQAHSHSGQISLTEMNGLGGDYEPISNHFLARQ